MDISVVVHRTPSPSVESGREEAGRAVRLNVVDETEGAVRLSRLLRTLAAVLERSPSPKTSGVGEAEQRSLRVAVKLAPDTRSDAPDAGSDGDSLSLRPPPRGPESSLNRADLEFVSHELRTPINAVMGYTSLLRERVYGDLSADQAEAVDRIRVAARNLLGALDHLRSVAELDLGRFEGNPDGDDGSGKDDERRATGDLTL